MSSSTSNVVDRRFALLIFILCLVMRVAYIMALEVDGPLRADAYKYFTLAYNLVNHGAYSLQQQAPFIDSTYITPGYPVFLSIILGITDSVDSFYQSTLFVQALLSSLSAVLVYYVGLRFLRRPFALLAAGLFIISPHLSAFSGYILTETLFVFFYLCSLYLFLEGCRKYSLKLLFAAGLILGLSTLVRPALMLFPAFLLAFMFLPGILQSARAPAILCLFAGFLLAYGPWVIWSAEHASANEPSLLASGVALGGYPDMIHKSPQLRGFPYREDKAFSKMSKSATNAASVILSRAKEQPGRYIHWYLIGKPQLFFQPNILIGQV